MLIDRLIPTVLCSSLLAVAACDKDESLGEVESESAGESETGESDTGESDTGESDTGEGTTGGDSDTGVDCPADAMICPDGTAVGRSGPDCAFDPCPGETSGTTGGETGGETNGETGGETEGEPVCAPDDEYFEPAGCPSDEGTGYVIDPGCHSPCEIDNDQCAEGSLCFPVEINPCVCELGEDCCDACGGGALLCVPVSMGEACDAIVGQSFSSIEQYECGLGPDGPVLCNWSVDFAVTGEYLWMYSDVGQGGDYACKDGVVSLGNAPQLEVSYDAENGVLTWDGIEYVAE